MVARGLDYPILYLRELLPPDVRVDVVLVPLVRVELPVPLVLVVRVEVLLVRVEVVPL